MIPKPKFQIGTRSFVRISLPSKSPGDADMLRGKAVVICNSLQCSAEVEFIRSDLNGFAMDLQRVHTKLSGSFRLESTDTRFRVVGTADNKGRVKIDVSVSGFKFSQPENTEWNSAATFTCYPQELEGAINELTKANKAEMATPRKPSD